jgi:hypothetical protein
MVSELSHEFGHGLGIGITSNLDTKTGDRGDGENTTWESLLSKTEVGLGLPPEMHFTGSHAQKVHGGPVVVTTNTPEENYGHLGNGPGDVTDPKTGHPDVMYGVSFNTGERYEVSKLDVAILQDLGYRTKAPAPELVANDDRISKMIHSLAATLPGTDAIRPVAADTLAHAVADAAAGDASPTHTSAGNIISDIANAVANAVGTASPLHNIFSDVAGAAHAVANAVGEASPTHTGDVLGDIANAVANAVGTVSHATGNVFTDGLAGAVHAVANAVGTAGTQGGSFWDQAADAVHHAMAVAGLPPQLFSNAGINLPDLDGGNLPPWAKVIDNLGEFGFHAGTNPDAVALNPQPLPPGPDPQPDIHMSDAVLTAGPDPAVHAIVSDSNPQSMAQIHLTDVSPLQDYGIMSTPFEPLLH